MYSDLNTCMKVISTHKITINHNIDRNHDRQEFSRFYIEIVHNFIGHGL